MILKRLLKVYYFVELEVCYCGELEVCYCGKLEVCYWVELEVCYCGELKFLLFSRPKQSQALLEKHCCHLFID